MKENGLDEQYTNLLKDILENGIEKETRNGKVLSVFGRTIRFKFNGNNFPLLTTKKMPFKTIVTELLWFLRGDTNIKYLVDNGCNIWNGDAYRNYESNWLKENPSFAGPYTDPCLTQEEFINQIKTDDKFANKWGELGPIYGKQWRKWPSIRRIGIENGGTIHKAYPDYGDVDQIQNLINDLKTNPDSRRLMVNAWNVGELDQMVLPPCHYGFQVYTRELSYDQRFEIFILKNERKFDWTPDKRITSDVLDELNIPTRAISLMWNQRSVDTFLGLPFNIASYGLLLEIIAKEVNMVADELIGNLGDVHLYSNHIDAAKEQIGRELTWEERRDIAEATMDKREFNGYKDEETGFYKGFGYITPFTDWAIHAWLDSKYIPKRTREPFPLPTLNINTEFWKTQSGECGVGPLDTNLQGFEISDFEIENYQSHPIIKAPLSN